MFSCLCQRPAPSVRAALRYGALALLVLLALEGCSSTTGPDDPDPVRVIVAWGDNDEGQCDVPSPNADFAEVSAGRRHSLGIRTP